MSKKNNNTKKSRSQHSGDHQKPASKIERIATVIIKPDTSEKIDAQTGNVSDLEMYHYLSTLTKHFASVLCADASDAVGDNPEDQLQYLDWRIEQSGMNG